MTTKPTYTPTLRFPDFLNDGEWEVKRLGEICIVNPPSKDIPNEFNYLDLESVVAGRIISCNRIKREGAPSRAQRLVQKYDVLFQMVRPYQQNNLYFLLEDGQYVASTGYAVLRSKEGVSDSGYLYHIVHSKDFLSQVLQRCTGSNYPAINSSSLEDICVPLPPLPEQRRIAQALTALDELIAATNEKLEQMKAYKKGLMQQLFVDSIGGGKSLNINYLQIPKLRFPEFYQEKEWEEKKLGDYLYEHKTKSDGKCQVYSVSVTKGVINQMEYLGRSFASSDTSNYKLVKPFDIVYTKSPTGEFPYGIIKQSLIGHNVIVSPLYGVFSPSNQYIGYIIHSYFESSTRTNNYLAPIVQKGAKNTIQISNDVFLSQNVCLPSNENEQRKIASCLSAMDETINAYTEKVGLLGQYKKGLMQQMFVN